MVSSNKKSAWIKGYEDLYKIYTNGKIVSFKQDKVKGKILKHKFSGTSGYAMVDLTRDGMHDDRYVHKLLAEAFVHNPHPRKFKYVIHKDGNHLNNSIGNLQWTNSAGRSEIKQMNREKILNKNNMFSSKLSNEDVKIIAQFFTKKRGNKMLSKLHKMFNVSNMTIHRLRKTKRYQEVVSKLESA